MNALQRLHRLVFAHKISADLAWTFGSFAILAVSGILINIIIAWTRDASALGVFNIAYAVYLIGSQIASLGIHYSVLRHAAYHQEQPEENGPMLLTAIVLSTLLGVVVSITLYLLAPYSIYLFDSANVADALGYAAFGLSLFPLNKTLISYANSLRHMKAFSVLQSIRYLTVLGIVTVVCLSVENFNTATLAFFAAELLTTICCFLYLTKAGLMRHLRFSTHWMKKHLAFGTKGVMAGIFLDLNTRLDVLLLGAMLSEAHVGIYSFAAMLVDGVQHILAIIRVNFNPILVKALRDRDHSLAMRMLTLSKRYVMAGTALLSAVLIVGFLFAVHYVITGKELEQGLASLLILLGGFTLLSAFAPFDGLLMISGHPGYQTAQSATVTVLNVVMCLFLVPMIGIEGAAIATVTGYVSGVAMLVYFSPRLVGWNLLTNHFATLSTNGTHAH